MAAGKPTNADLADAGRLLTRYLGFPGAKDIQEYLEKALRLWGLSREALQERTRAIWADGFRPIKEAPLDPVGSGFDTSDEAV